MIDIGNMPIDIDRVLESLKGTIADLQLKLAVKDCIIEELLRKIEQLDKPEELEKLEELMDLKDGGTDEQDKV